MCFYYRIMKIDYIHIEIERDIYYTEYTLDIYYILKSIMYFY